MMIQWVTCLDLIPTENTVHTLPLVKEEEKSSTETTAAVVTVQGDRIIQVAKRLHLHQ